MGRKGQKGRTRRLRLRRALLLVVAGGGLVAATGLSCDADCGDPSEPSAHDTTRSAESDVASAKDGDASPIDRELAASVVDFYGELAEGVFRDAYQRARRLAVVVSEFRKAPSRDGLDAARQAWLAARKPCLQTDVFPTFDDSGGPAGADASGGSETILEQAYELDGTSETGSEGAPKPPQNGPGYPYRPLRGLGAMEFLLWGPASADGPARPHTDFEVGGGTSQSTMRRRRTLLQASSKLLPEQLASASSDWRPDGPFREQLSGDGPDSGLATIVAELRRTASRLAGRELRGALEEGTSTRTGAPYAGDTRGALVATATGIANVYEGEYVRTDNSILEGPGLGAVVEAADAELHRRTQETLEAALEALRSMPEPLHEALESESGREAVRKAAERVEAVEKQMTAIAERLHLDLP